MVCLYCSGKTHVFNSRRQARNNNVWRRRRCLSCGAVFTSVEAPDLTSSLSVNRLGAYEPFQQDLLYSELLIALKGHKDRYIAARELSNSIMRNLIKDEGAAFTPRQISQAVSKVLRRFDKQAYQRYAAEHPSLST
jgi:transcriptional repressor NrdR